MAGLAGGRARSQTWVGSAIVCGGLVIAGFTTRGGLNYAIELGIVWGIAAVGLDVYGGFVGEPQFGQAAFVAVAAYLASWMRTAEGIGGLPAFLSCVVAAGIFGLLLGTITVRLGHFGSAVTTFFAGFVVLSVAQSTMLANITNAEAGITVPPLSLGGSPLTSLEAYFLAWGGLVGALGVAGFLAQGTAGRQWRLVKSNEIVASALGVNPRRVKRQALTLCGALAGVAGYLLAPLLASITPEVFQPTQSVMLFAMIVVGGIGSLSGAVIGSVGFELLSQVGVSSGDLSLLIFALVFLAFLIVLPEGVYGAFEVSLLWLWSKLRTLLRGVRVRERAFKGTELSDLPRLLGPMAGLKVLGTRRRMSSLNAKAPDAAICLAEVPMGGHLQVRDIQVAFGGVVALAGPTIEVEPGHIHAVIGPNGAGKTTLIGAITGVVRTQAGSIQLDGRELQGYPPELRFELGLARTFQHVALVDDLSVFENVLIGASALSGTNRPHRHDILRREAAAHALEWIGMPPAQWTRPAADLSGAGQKLVDVARACSGMPRLVLLDEPTSGLDDRESAMVEDAVRKLRSQGTSVLLVAHDVPLVRRLADTCTVLDFGRAIASGPVEKVLADEQVARAYLGASGAK